jgi:hypothetical protein
MSDSLRIEAAIQQWQPWLQSIQRAHRDLQFRPDFTAQELTDWEKKVGWHNAWNRARQEVDALILPRTFCPYWVACFCSDYHPDNPRTYYRIKLSRRVKRDIFTEGIPGSVLFFFQGSGTWHPTVEGNEVKMKLTKKDDDERVLPPFPLEFAVPIPLGLPVSIGSQKRYDKLTISPPHWTVTGEHWPRPELTPPTISPYITVRIPLFALGYGRSLFRQLNKQLRVMAEWMMNAEVHPLHGLMKRGPSPSYYREWAIEEIDKASDKVEAFHKVCDVLLLIEKAGEREQKTAGRGRAGKHQDFFERRDKDMRATVRRRVQKWLKQAGIRLR